MPSTGAYSRFTVIKNRSIWAHPFEEQAILGGGQYIDGCSICSSPKRYKHAVPYGMTELDPVVDALENQVSGWGYEMAMKYWTSTGVSDQEWPYGQGICLQTLVLGRI